MDGSDVIHFDGIRYVLTVSAAKQFDFTPDYLARLCREGKVSAKQFGRRWYVDPSAIQIFLAAQEQRRAELSNKRREEFQHVTAMRSAVARADVPAAQPHSIDYAAPSSAFWQNPIAWLGNASNGIHDLYATVVHAKEFCAQKSDGSEVCVTGDQLAALLSAAAASQNP
jgi:hypothetical protein